MPMLSLPRFIAAVLVCILMLFTVVALLNFVGMLLRPTDSTDFSRADRSGMVPMVDAATGCQYLRVSGGGITPRLNSRGAVVCGSTPLVLEP